MYDSFLEEIDQIKNQFNTTLERLAKDINRQKKIMVRTDQRQKREYDELQKRLNEVKELNEEIESTQREVIFTMGAIGESRCKETGNHVRRVAGYSYLLAKLYGLEEAQCQMLKDASPMHDVGKIAIPDEILKKPARYTEDEYEQMKQHAQLGYEMLNHSHRPLLQAAAIVAYEHHEKWDGTGYPRGLKGEEIHIFGRITAIADVFDALGSARVYKKAWSDGEIIDFFKAEQGRHFDPSLVTLLLENIEAVYQIRNAYQDSCFGE